MQVNFYYGPGSRYSYLAAAQIGALEERTGASFRWRAVYSPDLIRRAGANPFDSATLRGQYHAGYRSTDSARWSAS